MKNRYRELSVSEKSMPLFNRPWWLDTVAGPDNWDVVFVEKNDQLLAALPYVHHKKYIFNILGMPSLTQTLGPWLKDVKSKNCKKISREKNLINELFLKLPGFDQYRQCWNYKITNWLPLYWQGYRQTTKYTYRVAGIKDHDGIWKEVNENIRREIRKAENRFGLSIISDINTNEFYGLLDKVYQRQDRTTPYSKELIEKIIGKIKQDNLGSTYMVVDQEHRPYSCALIVRDDTTAYYLLGGSDPEFRNSGSMSFCLWHAIKDSSVYVDNFDFEGSMHEPIEKFFRSFGAEQTPYFEITKTNSRLLRTIQSVKYIVSQKNTL